jgi:regulator of nucleoside diphosphate kinase
MNTIVANERLLTEQDLARLTKLGAGRLPPELEEALEAHDTVGHADVPPDLVTLHSELRLRDLDTHRVRLVKLCEPGIANPTLGYISVLSPLGAALLGLREGCVARWPLPLGGHSAALIEKVLFVPAADGVAAS